MLPCVASPGGCKILQAPKAQKAEGEERGQVSQLDAMYGRDARPREFECGLRAGEKTSHKERQKCALNSHHVSIDFRPNLQDDPVLSVRRRKILSSSCTVHLSKSKGKEP